MGGHLQADQRPHECYSGTLEVDVMSVDIAQPLFCPVTRSFGTRPVDFFSRLCDVGEYGDMIVMYFHVTAEDRQIPPLLAPAVHQLALTEVGQERGMAREDAQITELTRDIQLIHLFLRQDTRRRDNFHRQRHD
jgi:hypothetical protein